VLEEVSELRAAFPGVNFVERDERFTTRLAAGTATGRDRRRGGRRGKGREPVDHLAAARILQEHLDAKRRR
jgi:RNase H-fold protein (predicted Holliday junction resolvase)